MRELTDQQIDRIFSAGFAEEAEQRAQTRASSADMTARVRAATKRRTYRRPLLLMAAALLIAGSVAVWIGTRPNIELQSGAVNCVSTLPEGWRLRMNLAPSGAKPDVVTLDRDGLLLRGSDNAGYEPMSSWDQRPATWTRQLAPQQADALVGAVEEAFPEGFCGTIASDPTQVSGPSIEAAGSHFVIVNGTAMQRARVSSQDELATYRSLISTLRDLVTTPPVELVRFEPDAYDLTVISNPASPTGPDIDNVDLPGGASLTNVGAVVAGYSPTTDVQVRCLTIQRDQVESYRQPLDELMAWNAENGAWLFSDDVDREVLVRINERRPYQAPCEQQQWPAPAVAGLGPATNVDIDPCALISAADATRALGRPVQGEASPGYFPEASGCIFRFNAMDRAPHVLGVRQVATRQQDFERLAAFYLGSEGLSRGATARGYDVFFNGCASTTTQARCAAVVASEPYLAIVYLPYEWDQEEQLLRAIVEAVTFPEED